MRIFKNKVGQGPARTTLLWAIFFFFLFLVIALGLFPDITKAIISYFKELLRSR